MPPCAYLCLLTVTCNASDEIGALFKLMDTDRSGGVSRQEFIDGFWGVSSSLQRSEGCTDYSFPAGLSTEETDEMKDALIAANIAFVNKISRGTGTVTKDSYSGMVTFCLSVLRQITSAVSS